MSYGFQRRLFQWDNNRGWLEQNLSDWKHNGLSTVWGGVLLKLHDRSPKLQKRWNQQDWKRQGEILLSKKKIAYLICCTYSMSNRLITLKWIVNMVLKIWVIVESENGLIAIIWKWRKHRGDISWRLPPGGPIAPQIWISCMSRRLASLRSYL